MDTSLSWIKAYVPDLNCSAQEYTDAMTLSGTKVEGYKEFDKTEIYSSFQSEKETYIEAINRIKNDKVEVECLVGMSGNIDVKELLNIRKNLDKM